MTAPILNLAELRPEARPADWAPPGKLGQRIEARIARLTPGLGLRHLGCGLVEVPPGRQAFPLHGHRHNDELFIILSGSGLLRHGRDRQPVREGDVIGCPVGDAHSAHALLNTGSQTLRYLALSSQHTPEICDYPDSGKFGVFDGEGEGEAEFFHLARPEDGRDYWDGE
ncbi:cupin domain-containing protein [Aquabacterium sp. OR-4]|uniref:cupin domain-containing protein n=1 Tax=Aquabacterium sp. OR-4 TaxID=2978127 RepID=UPI0021B329C9|nr:cupin domain-containing protein [Aquabacterium sp. OR-4]MDT7837851.1 cupin domain-containing protein [Aquabacterium sp. OR-4]